MGFFSDLLKYMLDDSHTPTARSLVLDSSKSVLGVYLRRNVILTVNQKYRADLPVGTALKVTEYEFANMGGCCNNSFYYQALSKNNGNRIVIEAPDVATMLSAINDMRYYSDSASFLYEYTNAKCFKNYLWEKEFNWSTIGVNR